MAAIEDVPSSVKIALYYINGLLEGYLQRRTEEFYSEQHIRQAFVTAYDGLEWDLTGVRLLLIVRRHAYRFQSCEIWDKWRDWELSLIEVRFLYHKHPRLLHQTSPK